MCLCVSGWVCVCMRVCVCVCMCVKHSHLASPHHSSPTTHGNVWRGVRCAESLALLISSTHLTSSVSPNVCVCVSPPLSSVSHNSCVCVCVCLHHCQMSHH